MHDGDSNCDSTNRSVYVLHKCASCMMVEVLAPHCCWPLRLEYVQLPNVSTIRGRVDHSRAGIAAKKNTSEVYGRLMSGVKLA